MRFHKRIVLPFAILGLVAAGLGAGSVPAQAGPSPSPSDKTCIARDADGQVTWTGDANMDMTEMGEDLAALIADHPGNATGTAFCSHYEGLAVYLSDPTPELTASIKAIGAQHPKAVIETHIVPHSLADLEATGRTLAVSLGLGDNMVGWGPVIYDGSLEVDVKEAALTQRVQAKTSVPSSSKGTSSPVAVSYRPGAEGQDAATRLADSSPWYMGGRLSWSNSYCSSGIPITVKGVHTLMTAGHCTGSSFTNNGSVVGTQYTMAYPGNANRYGDWKLIKGSSYAKRVFSGGLSSGDSHPITAARWATLPLGNGMCTSGSTSGQICRYKVNSTGRSLTVDGVTSNHLIELYHGTRDKGGFRGGDSGGTCYYANSNGMTVAGIVKGTKPWPKGMSYYCTDLMGLRAWNSSAALG